MEHISKSKLSLPLRTKKGPWKRKKGAAGCYRDLTAKIVTAVLMSSVIGIITIKTTRVQKARILTTIQLEFALCNASGKQKGT